MVCGVLGFRRCKPPAQCSAADNSRPNLPRPSGALNLNRNLHLNRPPNLNPTLHLTLPLPVFPFSPFPLEFVSDFDIRISDLVFHFPFSICHSHFAPSRL